MRYSEAEKAMWLEDRQKNGRSAWASKENSKEQLPV